MQTLEQPANCRNAFSSPLRMIARMSPAARAEFESLLHISNYPSGVAVFTEGEPATRFYLILEGEIRVSISSPEGKRLNLRIARKDDVLGLSSVLANGSYNATAETIFPARLAHVERAALRAFLAHQPSAYLAVAEELSRKVTTACEQLRTVALSHSAPEKLARLLLEWSENGQTLGASDRIRFSMTHEQIGEFIGASRETVTRTLTTFKRRHLIQCEGSMLTILNRDALESYSSV
jgi:CRP/FNR family transcriptional regulator